jgi:hypothetical protein
MPFMKVGSLICANRISHYTCSLALYLYLTLTWTEMITEQNCRSIHHVREFNIVLSAERITDDTLRSMILKLFVRYKT